MGTGWREGDRGVSAKVYKNLTLSTIKAFRVQVGGRRWYRMEGGWTGVGTISQGIQQPYSVHDQAVTVQEGGIPGAVAQTSQSEGTPSVTVSQLHFPSVQPHHAGLYVCLAANTPGTARATLSLRVMCEYRALN